MPRRDVNAMDRLRAVVAREGTQRQAARWLGVTEAYVSDLMNGRRKFSDRILGKLGLERQVVEKMGRPLSPSGPTHDPR